MGEPVDRTLWGELEPEEEEEEESEEESEEEEEEEQQEAPAGGMQTPSGLETPSGMASVVSTVAGGLETPDFLELRKNARAPSEATDSGPRSLYQVVPEKQTSVRGLMGSERGYDVSAVAGNGAIPVLGDERGTKVRASECYLRTYSDMLGTAETQRCGRLDRCRGARGHVDGGPAPEVRPALPWQCGRPWSKDRGLLRHDWEGDGAEKAEGGQRQRASEREGLQVLTSPASRRVSWLPVFACCVCYLFYCTSVNVVGSLRISAHIALLKADGLLQERGPESSDHRP